VVSNIANNFVIDLCIDRLWIIYFFTIIFSK